MNYWEIIADNLSKAGWSWGCVAAIDFERANDLDCGRALRQRILNLRNTLFMSRRPVLTSSS
jgi:hypothetical protein